MDPQVQRQADRAGAKTVRHRKGQRRRVDFHYRPPRQTTGCDRSQPQSRGIEGWTELRTRPDRDDLLSVQVYKTAERTKVEAEGYTIIANVGDQISDFEGEHSGCTFKVPNPFYFIR
jgi:hypothetical protein